MSELEAAHAREKECVCACLSAGNCQLHVVRATDENRQPKTAAAAAAAPIRPSFPPFAPLFLFHFRQAKVAQSRQRVLPVPVGDSSRALVPCFCEVVSVRVFFK